MFFLLVFYRLKITLSQEVNRKGRKNLIRMNTQPSRLQNSGNKSNVFNNNEIQFLQKLVPFYFLSFMRGNLKLNRLIL